MISKICNRGLCIRSLAASRICLDRMQRHGVFVSAYGAVDCKLNPDPRPAQHVQMYRGIMSEEWWLDNVTQAFRASMGMHSSTQRREEGPNGVGNGTILTYCSTCSLRLQVVWKIMATPELIATSFCSRDTELEFAG